MQHLDDEETAALAQELHDIIERDRYPFSHPNVTVHPHMLRQRRTGREGMTAPAGGQDAERRLNILLAFVFGCVSVVVVLVLAFAGDSLDDRRFEILKGLFALGGGGLGGVFLGFLDVKLALNMKAGTRLALQASGGLAVFVVLYFWSPAHWVAQQPGSVRQHTSGANSPAINGNGNSVTGGPVR